MFWYQNKILAAIFALLFIPFGSIFGQNMGIGELLPTAKLHVRSEGLGVQHALKVGHNSIDTLFFVRNDGALFIRPIALPYGALTALVVSNDGQIGRANLNDYARKDTLAFFARVDTLNYFATKDTLNLFASKDTLSNFFNLSTTLGGDLSGTLPNPTVVGLQGLPIVIAGTPTTGQVLTWNGSAWVAQNTNALVAANNGLSIGTGNVVQMGGDLIQNTGIGFGNFSLNYDLNGTGNFNVRQNGNPLFNISSQGNVGVGTESPNPNAILELNSTTKGFMPPRLSAVQKNTLGTALGNSDAGMMVFDTDSVKYYYWDGDEWLPFGTGGGGSGTNYNFDINNIIVLEWDWGTVGINAPPLGNTITLSGTWSVLNIPDTATVLVAFDPPLNPGDNIDFVLTDAWMEPDAVVFKIYRFSAFSNQFCNLSGTRYIFIW